MMIRRHVPRGAYDNAKTALTVCRLHLGTLALAALVWFPRPALGEDGAKSPVPAAAAQEEAQKLVREVYGGRFAGAKTPEQKASLARKMLQDAPDPKSDPAGCYVMLRIARDVAVGGGDLAAALEAIEKLDEGFEVDATAMKLAALETAASAAKTPVQHVEVAKAALGLMDEAAAEDQLDAALRLGEAAATAARRAKAPDLVKQVAARQSEVRKQQSALAEVTKAQERLKEVPDDPEANSTVGRYLCFVKGYWEEGIASLALGSDQRMKALAVSELKKPGAAAEQIALADGWWDLAQGKDGAEKEALLAHAGTWYRLAEPELAPGLVRAKVEKRLQEISALAGQSGKAGPGESAPSQPVAVWEWTPQNITSSFKPVEIDVSKWIKEPGTYEVRFQYEKGPHHMECGGVVLSSRGRLVDRDIHNGSTGGRNEANTYKLKVAAVPARPRFVLTATVRAAETASSYGRVWLQRLGP